MKTTKSVLGKALLPAVVVLALGIFIGLGFIHSRLLGAPHTQTRALAVPTPPAQIMDYDVQGAPGDGCYQQPFPCYSTQAFWLAGLDANVFTTGCGVGPNGGTDGLHYIFTAGAFNTTPTPGVFSEFPNGTATLTGHIESTILPGRGFDVDVSFVNFTATPDPMGPLKELNPSCYGTGTGQVDISTWHYYQTVQHATLTGTGNYAGAVVQLTPVMHFPEFGPGASGKDVMVGGSGWFTWTVTSQPTNGNFHLNTNPPAGFQGDFNIVTGNPHLRDCVGQIGDFVWQDTNGNGCQDAGEPGMANVQVDLYVGLNCGGAKVFQRSTMTDGNGHYLFDHLCPGNYTICFHTPNGFTPTTVGANCGANSTAKDSNCSSTECNICINLPNNDSQDLTIDCGYIPGCAGTIGDFVWQDNNTNGCQDNGEPGIAGVQVDLFTGCGAGKVFKTSVMTDANGHYLFTNLCAGNYTVCFHTPDGFNPTIHQAPSCNGGVNPNLLDSDCSSTDCNICVNLPTDHSSDITIDCGYIPTNRSECMAEIGDFVWQDLNGNGCQDAGEPGMQGVTVDLYMGCGDGKTLLGSKTTGANGQYLFGGLCAGTYTVCFHTPTGFNPTQVGASCGVNSTGNDSNCSAQDCNICVTLPANDTINHTIDCGYISSCPGQIGDFVWNDLNSNGCQDPGEPGIQGIQVELFAGCPASGSVLQTKTTDANGKYLFTGLCGGNYSVRFHTPGGFTHTVSGSACGGTPGDPHNPNDSNCQCTGAVDCDVCVILPNGGSDLTVDCGYNVVPTPLPCPAGLFLGGKTTGGGLPGDISLAFDQFPAPNDNSYGINAIGWGGPGKHKFGDLTSSDKAGFQILRPNGTVAVSFNVDYLSSSTLGAPPSSYKSLGPFGGDGGIVTNSTPALTSDGTTIQWDTSFARDLNGPQSPFGTYSSPTYFTGGVQTIGTSGTNSASLLTDSPPVNCSLASDPSTCITTYGTPKGDQYPLAVPNPWNASYNNPEYAVVPIGSSAFENAIARHVDGWNFHDTYFVTFKQSYLTAIGFDFNNFAIANYNPATNTFTCASGKWCVAPNPTVLHNSPAKACPIPATVVVTAKSLSSKNVKITFQNNTTTGQVLTGLSITWPQATNGNLTTIKLGGTTVYSTSTGGGSLTTSSLLGTTAQRTINANGHQDLTFTFLNNVDTNASHYTGSVTFNPFGNVTILP